MSSTTSSSNRKAQLAGRWKKFEASMKDMIQYSPIIAECENMADQMDHMREELTKKEEEIAAAQTTNKSLTAQFAEEAGKWNAEKAGLNKEIEKVRNRQEASWFDERRKLLDENNEARKSLEKNEKKMQTMSISLRGAQDQLAEYRDELETLQEDIGLEDLGDEFITELEDLAQRLHKLSKQHFYVPYPNELDTDHLFMKLKTGGSPIINTQKIPISNSSASLHLRVAAFEATVAERMVESIFQNLHLRSANEQGLLNSILNYFLQTDPQKEAILRSILATAHVGDRPNAMRSLVNSIVEDIFTLFAPLLPSNPNQSSLKKDLYDFLIAAEEIWSLSQKNRFRIVATVNATEAIGEWGYHNEHNAALQPIQNQEDPLRGNSRPVMITFPQIYFDNQTETIPLFCGYALWSNQDLITMGLSEFRQQTKRVASLGEGSVSSTSGTKKGSISKTSPRQRIDSFTSSQHSPTMATRLLKTKRRISANTSTLEQGGGKEFR